MMRASATLLPFVLLGFGGCPSSDSKETADTNLPDGCAYVTGACSIDETMRTYLSTCEGGGWDHVQQCNEVECAPVEHGELIRTGNDTSEVWADPWVDCDLGSDRYEGVICCVQ